MIKDTAVLNKLLEEQRTIVIHGEVNDEMLRYVGACIIKLRVMGNPSITVVIDSSGGDVTSGLDIYDLLSTYPAAIEGIVVEQVCSMATVILQACSKRAATQHARILIHHLSRGSISLDELRSKHRHNKIRERMEERQQYLYKILCSRTGRSLAQIRRECAKDTALMPPQALALGLIDSIVPLRDDLLPRQTTS